MKGFDRHLEKLLAANPEAALEHARLFAALPLQTQLALMRRRRKLSQRGMAKKLRVAQPQVARTESRIHDPRISSVVRAAKALGCHVLVVADEELARLRASA